MPWDFEALPRLHKAALIGMIQAKVEQDRKDRAAAEAAGKGKKGRR